MQGVSAQMPSRRPSAGAHPCAPPSQCTRRCGGSCLRVAARAAHPTPTHPRQHQRCRHRDARGDKEGLHRECARKGPATVVGVRVLPACASPPHPPLHKVWGYDTNDFAASGTPTFLATVQVRRIVGGGVARSPSPPPTRPRTTPSPPPPCRSCSTTTPVGGGGGEVGARVVLIGCCERGGANSWLRARPPPPPVLETGTLSLPWVLSTWLPSRGLKAVTVGECLGLPSSAQWYTSITAPSVPDATWTCAGAPAPGAVLGP